MSYYWTNKISREFGAVACCRKDAITFRHKGKVRKFYRSGETLPYGKIPGYLKSRQGNIPGTLVIHGDGFKFTPGAV